MEIWENLSKYLLQISIFGISLFFQAITLKDIQNHIKYCRQCKGFRTR